MSIPRPNRVISSHEMSHILSGIDEYSRLTGETVWESIHGQLIDVGYFPSEIDQIHREWKCAQPERTPITEDVDYFGDGSFSIEPNWDNGDPEVGTGINLVIYHGDGVTQRSKVEAALAVSVAEADRILVSLDRAIVQTGGASHLAACACGSLSAWLAGTDRPDGGEIYNEVAEAVSVDAGHVREALAVMLLGLHENLPGSNLAEIAHSMVEDAIALEAELER